MRPSEQIIEELLKDVSNPRIAFLPYKAAMWDCMEPLYLECIDRGIEADLIPLDYMTFPGGVFHNEKRAFNGLGYNTFDSEMIRDKKYDFMVTHYPYDGCNNVTKLYPDNFTWELKKLSKIVYIPYHGNIESESWSRFFRMPGARESDYICLGSQFDVDVFKKTVPDYSGKIIQTEYSTKVECAKDWEPVVVDEYEHPMTLICGTLWTFTHDPEERMEKHLKIIEKALKESKTVIYRPHPLVYEAIAVMRPEYLKKYEEFLGKVEELCYLDKNQDLHIKIALADKLYCDPSSVQRTWEGTGKPYEVIE